MRTGPKHYREAESFLDLAGDFTSAHDDAGAQTAASIAQVHATLALVASKLDTSDPEWIEVLR